MRANLFDNVERCRLTDGPLASKRGDGPQGAFLVPGPRGDRLVIVASDGRDWNVPFGKSGQALPGDPWEHVSVHVDGPRRDGAGRCPTWAEMCFVKYLFWAEDEWVVQFHPGASENVNLHRFTLHLWRPVGGAFPKPPAETRMRKSAITCDLCGALEKAEHGDNLLHGRFTWPLNWNTVTVEGKDHDICPACWKRLLGQIRAELRAKP